MFSFLSKASALCLLLLATPLAAQQEDGLRMYFDIPSQRLEDALLVFSKQSGLAVLVSPSSTLDIKSSAIKQDMQPLEALKQLLGQSDFEFKRIGQQGIVIQPIGIPTAALATTANKTQTNENLLEEVIVTASKRSSNLQDTPMAVTALNGSRIEQHGVDNVSGLSRHVPNFHVTRNGDHSATMLYLRGIGSDNYTEAGDSGVASHVDGVYISRSQGASALLYDLERIEVLRGPQGTLFGRNSTGGNITYITAKPGDQLEAKLALDLSNHQQSKLNGVLNLPASDDLHLRFALSKTTASSPLSYQPGSQAATRSNRYNNKDMLSYRVSGSYVYSEAINWLGNYERFEDNGAGVIPLVDYDTPVLVDTPGQIRLAANSYRSRLNWALSDQVELTYISGYSELNRRQLWDGDRAGAVGSNVDPLIYHQSNLTDAAHHTSWQHEVQLKSADNSRLRWLGAYFYFKEKNSIRFDIEHQAPNGGGWGGAASHSFQQPNRGSELSAFYGQLSYDLSPRWTLSGGARTGRDRRFDQSGRNIACPDLIQTDRLGDLGVIAPNAASAGPLQCYVINYNDVSVSWSGTSYMGRLEYRHDQDSLFYLLYAEGFKPGIVQDGNPVEGQFSGFTDPNFNKALTTTIKNNNDPNHSQHAYVDPEYSRNLELGFKLERMDGTLNLNGALFNTHYTDLQVSGVATSSQDTQLVRSLNAASATITGLELELNWALGSRGQLSGNMSYLDARYDHFYGIDNEFVNNGQTWNPSTNNPNLPDQLDFSGNRMKFAPKFSANISYSLNIPLGESFTLSPTLSTHYTSKVYFSEANRGSRSGTLFDHRLDQWVDDPNGPASNIDMQGPSWVWYGSLSLRPNKQQWSVQLYVQNISQETTRLDVDSPEIQQPEYYLAPPRTIGLKFTASFD